MEHTEALKIRLGSEAFKNSPPGRTRPSTVETYHEPTLHHVTDHPRAVDRRSSDPRTGDTRRAIRHGTLSDVRQVPGRHRSKNVAALSCRSQASTGICAMLRGGFCYNFVTDCPPTNFSSKKHQNYNDLQSNMTQSLNSDGNTSSYKATKQ